METPPAGSRGSYSVVVELSDPEEPEESVGLDVMDAVFESVLLAELSPVVLVGATELVCEEPPS